jgi:APA family basic amino acid/polyamine antiporter/L-type amino acid transporter 9
VFRKRGYNPPFRAPLYPVAPILFVLATLYLLVNALIDETSRWPTLAIFGIIILGIPVYYATVGRNREEGSGKRQANAVPTP